MEYRSGASIERPDAGRSLGCRARGDCRRITRQGFAVAAPLDGTVTAVTGLIGFAGLIVPHVLRRVLGSNYPLLIPACWLGGGVFLVFCDSISRSVLTPVEIPVGVTTVLLGGPVFIWLLWSRWKPTVRTSIRKSIMVISGRASKELCSAPPIRFARRSGWHFHLSIVRSGFVTPFASEGPAREL